MSEDTFKCPKCKGKMVKGFLCSYAGERQYFPNYFVEGEPVKASILGIEGVNLEIGGQNRFTIRSLRCEKCGFLESYAV